MAGGSCQGKILALSDSGLSPARIVETLNREGPCPLHGYLKWTIENMQRLVPMHRGRRTRPDDEMTIDRAPDPAPPIRHSRIAADRARTDGGLGGCAVHAHPRTDAEAGGRGRGAEETCPTFQSRPRARGLRSIDRSDAVQQKIWNFVNRNPDVSQNVIMARVRGGKPGLVQAMALLSSGAVRTSETPGPAGESSANRCRSRPGQARRPSRGGRGGQRPCG